MLDHLKPFCFEISMRLAGVSNQLAFGCGLASALSSSLASACVWRQHKALWAIDKAMRLFAFAGCAGPSNQHRSQGFGISTGERPLVDTIADRRYWLIHLLTVPSLFPARFTSVLAGLSAVTTISHATNEILNNRF